MTWATNEARDEIADMLAAGATGAQIAARFGVARNAVIGIVHRDKRLRQIGFKRKPGQAADRSGLSVAAARKRGGIRGGKVSLNRLKAPTAVPLPEPAFERATFGAPAVAGIPLLMLTPRRCKWCVNDPEPGANGHLFCGTTTDGGSYCGYHATIAVGSGTESERSADRILRAA